MKKSRKFLLPASLIGGGMILGSVFSPVALAGAQETEDTTNTDQTSEHTAGHSGRRDRGGMRQAVLTELGITAEDVAAGAEAGQTLVEVAANAGVSESELVAALEAANTERVAQALADGKIDAEKAAEIEAGMSEKISERINTVVGSRSEARQERREARRAAAAETLAELGLDEDTVKTGREAGKTLTEIAGEAGVSEADLVDALVADAEERLAAATEAGNVDEDKAAEIAENIEERVTNRVNRTPGERPERAGRG